LASGYTSKVCLLILTPGLIVLPNIFHEIELKNAKQNAFKQNSSTARPPAILALADGTVFQGVSIGAEGHTVAEVVFNTAMTGYHPY